MARRYSSSRSRSSRPAPAPRIDADGKVEVFCPQCGTRFRLLETALDERIECNVCQNRFIARNTVGKVARGKDNTKVYVAFALGAALVITSLIVISNMNTRPQQGSGGNVAAANAPKIDPLALERQRRRDQAIKWARGVAAGDLFRIHEYSDVEALCRALGVDKRLPKDDKNAAILAALKLHTGTRLLYELECNSAEMSADSAKNDSGTVVLHLTPKADDQVYDRLSHGEMSVDFRMDAGNLRVLGFRITQTPAKKPGR